MEAMTKSTRPAAGRDRALGGLVFAHLDDALEVLVDEAAAVEALWTPTALPLSSGFMSSTAFGAGLVRCEREDSPFERQLQRWLFSVAKAWPVLP